MKVTWRRDWPDSEGYWWFYGWKFGQKSGVLARGPARFHLVKVRHGRNCLVVIGDGHFWYPQEGAEGWFAKAQLPTPPDK